MTVVTAAAVAPTAATGVPTVPVAAAGSVACVETAAAGVDGRAPAAAEPTNKKQIHAAALMTSLLLGCVGVEVETRVCAHKGVRSLGRGTH